MNFKADADVFGTWDNLLQMMIITHTHTHTVCFFASPRHIWTRFGQQPATWLPAADGDALSAVEAAETHTGRMFFH